MARQRSDGRWEVRFMIGKERKSAYGATKAEANANAAKARYEAGLGYPEASDLTLAQYMLNLWLPNTVTRDCRPKTVKSYRYTVEQYIVPAIGHLKMSEIRPTTMAGFRVALEKKKYEYKRGYSTVSKVGVPPASIYYACNVLRIAIRSAVEEEVIARYPFAEVRLDRPEKKEFETWTVEQAETFFAYMASQNHRLWAFFELDVLTGLRHGELHGLRWEDIDLKAGTIHVRHTLMEDLVNGRTEFTLQPVKTKKSKAIIPIPARAVAALRRHRAARFAEGQRSEFVFLTSNGTHYLQSNALRTFHEISKKLELPKVRIHDLRHTCATLLLEAGKDLKDIQHQLRHSDYTITANTYAHVTKKKARETADTMDQIFGGTK